MWGGAQESLYSGVPCAGGGRAGGVLYSEVQCIIGNGYKDTLPFPVKREIDTNKNINFQQVLCGW